MYCVYKQTCTALKSDLIYYFAARHCRVLPVGIFLMRCMHSVRRRSFRLPTASRRPSFLLQIMNVYVTRKKYKKALLLVDLDVILISVNL